MSIDAIVDDVRYNDDGTATLVLKDRPGGDRGQNSLTIVNPNPHMRGLIGLTIWGGSESVLHRDTIIADRIGYTRIRLRAPTTTDGLIRWGK